MFPAAHTHIARMGLCIRKRLFNPQNLTLPLGYRSLSQWHDLHKETKREPLHTLTLHSTHSPRPQVLRRVWCLFEIWKTVNYHDVDGLVVLAKDVDLLGLKVRGIRLVWVWLG